MNLYLRLLVLFVRLIGLPRTGLFDESRVAFRVLPTDCDVNLHMNNGRYLSFMDLGRLHLVAQIGLLRIILRRRWAPPSRRRSCPRRCGSGWSLATSRSRMRDE